VADQGRTIVVVEHALTDTVVYIGKKGDSLANQLVFANPLFDAANAHQVGHDQGNCVRVTLGKAWECYWTAFLPGGQLTVEGPYYDTGDSILAVTGGTGRYRAASGELHLHARDARGSEYTFTYVLNQAPAGQ
jgi:hypothetical protein